MKNRTTVNDRRLLLQTFVLVLFVAIGYSVGGQQEANECLQEFATRLNNDLEGLSLGSTACPVCNDNRVECMATTIAECFFEGGIHNDEAVCFETSISEQVQNGLASLSVVLDVALEYNDQHRIEFRRQFNNDQTDCTFLWDDEECQGCTMDCTEYTTGSSVGIGLDCSNIHSEIVFDCMPHGKTQPSIPAEIIVAIGKVNARKQQQDTIDEWTQFCSSFENIGSGISTCSTCTEEEVVCDQPANAQDASCMTLDDKNRTRVCYETSTRLEVNFQDRIAVDRQEFRYTSGYERTARIYGQLDFSGTTLENAVVRECTFLVDEYECDTCIPCSDGQTTIDCSNLFRGASVTCVPLPEEILPLLPLVPANVHESYGTSRKIDTAKGSRIFAIILIVAGSLMVLVGGVCIVGAGRGTFNQYRGSNVSQSQCSRDSGPPTIVETTRRDRPPGLGAYGEEETKAEERPNASNAVWT